MSWELIFLPQAHCPELTGTSRSSRTQSQRH